MKRYERMAHFFYSWSRALFISVGHDIYREGGFKPNLLTFFMYIVLLSFFFAAFYTLIFYDWFTRLAVCANMAVAFELAIKMLSIRHGDIVVSLVEKLIEIFRVNENVKKHGRQEMLQRFLIFTEYLFKVGITIYFMSLGGYIAYPLYMYQFFDEIIPMIPVYLPFVDENTYVGFTILSIFHLNMMIFAVLGSACSDFSFTMVIVNVPVLGNITCDNITDLNEILAEECPEPIQIKAKFKNIMLQHREIKEFIDSLDTTFFKICFVQISVSVLGMSCTLFLGLKYHYLPAFALTMSFIFQIVSYCAIGLVVELTNDKIYDGIIRADWYLMPIDEQIKYMFLMQNAQHPQALTVGGIVPLNMVTCVSIFKSIYTYLMLLLNFA